jgi:hypothetical protein
MVRDRNKKLNTRKKRRAGVREIGPNRTISRTLLVKTKKCLFVKGRPQTCSGHGRRIWYIYIPCQSPLDVEEVFSFYISDFASRTEYAALRDKLSFARLKCYSVCLTTFICHYIPSFLPACFLHYQNSLSSSFAPLRDPRCLIHNFFVQNPKLWLYSDNAMRKRRYLVSHIRSKKTRAKLTFSLHIFHVDSPYFSFQLHNIHH